MCGIFLKKVMINFRIKGNFILNFKRGIKHYSGALLLKAYSGNEKIFVNLFLKNGTFCFKFFVCISIILKHYLREISESEVNV